MQAPTRADYVRVYFTLFERFQQEREQEVHYGHPFEYTDQVLIVFVTMIIIRRITAFKAQVADEPLAHRDCTGFRANSGANHAIATLQNTLFDLASLYRLCRSLGRSFGFA